MATEIGKKAPAFTLPNQSGHAIYGRVSQGVVRFTVRIDPAGKVAHHWRKVKSTGHAEKLLQRQLELQKQL